MFSDHVMKLIGMVLGMGVFITACASVRPPDSTNPRPAGTEAGNGIPAPPASPPAKKVDTEEDIWEKQRAAYLRSLDFAKIDQQKTKPSVYNIKAVIVNSRYHIGNSETDLIVAHNAQNALQELQSAKQSFTRAIRNAPPKDVHALDNSKSMLDDLIKRTRLSMKNKSDAPSQADYRLLEARLENLLATL
jgi:hypothetical protein